MANVKLDLGGVSVIVPETGIKLAQHYKNNFGATLALDENSNPVVLSDNDVSAIAGNKNRADDSNLDAMIGLLKQNNVKGKNK